MCLYPQTIRNKNTASAINQSGHINVPCGKCAECLNLARSQWSLRLNEELKVCQSAYFITLTYNDEHLPYNEHKRPSVNLKDTQLFLKRLRKQSGLKIRYFLTSEYGTNTFRPHYHIIMFNLSCDFDEASRQIFNAWKEDGKPIGNVQIGSVTPASIHYVTGYQLQKSDVPYLANKNFCTMSRNPGLGANYIETMFEWHNDDYLNRTFCPMPGNNKVPMPRYYKNKLFHEHQRTEIAQVNKAKYQSKHGFNQDRMLNAKTFEQYLDDNPELIKKHTQFEIYKMWFKENELYKKQLEKNNKQLTKKRTL